MKQLNEIWNVFIVLTMLFENQLSISNRLRIRVFPKVFSQRIIDQVNQLFNKSRRCLLSSAHTKNTNKFKVANIKITRKYI